MKHHADCDDRPCACGSGLSFKECRCDRYWERLLGDEQPRWLYYLSLGSRIASIIIVVGYLVLYLYGFATAQQKSPEPQQWGMVVGIWKGGRKGIYREDKNFKGLARGEKGEAPVGAFDGYEPLIAEIVKFFQTGVAPVPPEETIEIFAFMEAADASKVKGGQPVPLKKPALATE